jgi:hypothetical protein
MSLPEVLSPKYQTQQLQGRHAKIEEDKHSVKNNTCSTIDTRRVAL